MVQAGGGGREWHGVRCAGGPLMQLLGGLGSTGICLGVSFLVAELGPAAGLRESGVLS